MDRTKRFMFNAIAQAIAQVIMMISGFIIPKIMLSAYGSEINGLVNSATQFISYFNLVEAGISGAAIYALYKPIATSNKEQITNILDATSVLYKKSGIIFLILILVLSILYPMYMKMNSLSHWEITILIILLGLNGAIEYFAQGKYKVFLTASQRLYVISCSNIACYVSNTVITILCFMTNSNIIFLKLIASLSLLFRLIILSYYCRKTYDKSYFNTRYNLDRTLDFSLLNKRFDALILQILGVIQAGAPIIILTIILKNLKVVSIYSIYAMVISGVNNLTGIFISGVE